MDAFTSPPPSYLDTDHPPPYLPKEEYERQRIIVPVLSAPSVPAWNTSPQDVKRFLASFWLYTLCSRDIEEANKQASKFPAHGKAIHTLSREHLVIKWGELGDLLYLELYYSQWGYGGSLWRPLSVIGKVCLLLLFYLSVSRVFTCTVARDIIGESMILTGMACCTTIVALIETLFMYREHDRMRAIFGSGENGQEKGGMVVLCLPAFIFEIWRAAKACRLWVYNSFMRAISGESVL